MAKKLIVTPPQDPPDDDDDEGVEFTPKQLEILNNTVTAAVNAHVKRHVKPLQDQLSVLPTIQETLEKLAASGGVGAGAADPANGGKAAPTGQQGAPAKIEDHPQFIAQQRRLAAIEQEREQERVAARHAKRDATLIEIATKAGVDKNRVRGAVALLKEQVKYDKEGNASMSVKRHGIDEEVTIEEGATAFFNSDEGKAYIAPSQPVPRGGTGAGRGATSAAGVTNRGQSGQGNAPARGQGAAKEERKQKAAENFVGAVSELFSGGNIDVGG